ncbi:MAG: tRNA pseudouridine(55) synthase TruB [Vicinamibacterales bacterium]
MPDGLLVVDKPVGPTSHDIVIRLRRALREQRIGHTGTLDPLASGVLTMVVGRATRLARFLATDEKAYESRIQLGRRTDTYDAEGSPVGRPYTGPWPAATLVEAALQSFVGTFLQQPPAFSAKKVAGQRAYALARAHARAGRDEPAPQPAPVRVTLSRCELTAYEKGVATVTLTCSAGFYVRSLAHDLGEHLGTGGHVSTLRRTRSGLVTLADARTLQEIEADPGCAAEALVPMARMLSHLPALTLTETGLKRAQHGARLGSGDLVPYPPEAQRAWPAADAAPTIRLLCPDGALLAIARAVTGVNTTEWQPEIVLG